MNRGLPQFPGVLGPHRASGVRPWLPQLLPSVEDLFGCGSSVADGGMVSNMATKKTKKPSDRDWKTSDEKWLERRVWLPRQSEIIGYVDRTPFIDKVGAPKFADRLVVRRAPEGVYAPAKSVKKKGKSKKA